LKCVFRKGKRMYSMYSIEGDFETFVPPRRSSVVSYSENKRTGKAD